MCFEKVEFFMGKALQEAKLSLVNDCVPIGAIIVLNDRIIGYGRNKNDSFLMHAEIECIKNAERNILTKYLSDCEMFVTLKPCLMCHYAIFLSKIKKVFYGASSIFELEDDFLSRCYNEKKIEYYGGFFEKDSSLLLKNFFFNKRKKMLTCFDK
jgi:tRNA(adenine34) deaminase